MADPSPNPEGYPRLRVWWEQWHPRHRLFRSLPGWPWWVAGLVLAGLFVLIVLPYLLPLDGPAIQPPARLADANGAFVEVEGEQLYIVHEPGTGPALLLIHGFGGSTVSWTDTVEALAGAEYDVYAVDLLGFGLSDKGLRHDYSYAAQAARVVGLMDALGIQRATLVGHSMGGNVAAYVALAHADRVERLVLVDAAILRRGEIASVPSFLFDLPFARRWAQVILRRSLASASTFSELLYSAAYHDGAITPALVEAYERPLHTPQWDLGLLGIVRDSGKSRLPGPLSDIQVPCLIVWGEKDSWVPPGDGVRLEERLPHAERIVIPDVGHLPMHEAPDAFNGALLDFLRKTD